MISMVLVGLAGLVGGALVVAYWDEIVDWLADFIPRVRQVFSTAMHNVAHAAGMFVQKVKDAYAKIMHKLYYKEEGKWVEETTSREIKESEVPPWIRNKISAQERDMTDEFESKMDLQLN